jgi:hypothetical protein
VRLQLTGRSFSPRKGRRQAHDTRLWRRDARLLGGGKPRRCGLRASWICVLPGTELAFASDVTIPRAGFLGWKELTLGHRTAIFRQIDKEVTRAHHDALEFPDGRIVLLTHLCEGQEATVLQLPAQPTTEAEVDQQTRAEYVG